MNYIQSFTLRLLVFLVGVFAVVQVRGSHLLACYLDYRDLGGNTLELRIVTYSDPSWAFVDRCS